MARTWWVGMEQPRRGKTSVASATARAAVARLAVATRRARCRCDGRGIRPGRRGCARPRALSGRAGASPVVGMVATPDGQGYWLAAADGGMFPFGDAGCADSRGSSPPGSPVTGIAIP